MSLKRVFTDHGSNQAATIGVPSQRVVVNIIGSGQTVRSAFCNNILRLSNDLY